MFARQWFGPNSQIGLEQVAQEFESLLRRKKFSIAIELANTQVITATRKNSQEFWKRQSKRAFRLQQRCNYKFIITIAFRGFWPGFREEENEILNLLKSAAYLIGNKIQISSTDPDLVIYSCFGDPQLGDFPKATRVLYLGENVRPDFGNADYSLTFDRSNYCGRNIYLPLWLLRSTKYAIITCDYQSYVPAELEKTRIINEGIDGIAYVGNNSTALRIEAISELRHLGMKVDCYGSQTKPVSDKIQTLRGYRYSLCFENSYTPGYVTEKIIDSFIAGSFPIYWGGAPPETFNLECYYVCNPYETISKSMSDFVEWRKRKETSYLPPLLKPGAFNRAESAVMINLATILLDLF